MRRTHVFVLVFAALLASAVSPVLDAQTDARTFEIGMKKIHAVTKTGRWKRALSLLEALLEDHARADYVLARRSEIVDLDRQCRFRVRFPMPDPDEVVSGDLVTCDVPTGKIKIRYERHNLRDFKNLNRLFRLHTAKFAGPYTIEIKGQKYPSLGFGGGLGGSPPTIWVCWENEDGFAVSFGFQQVGNTVWGGGASWVPARIVAARTQGVVAEKEMTLARGGKPFHLKVIVGKRSIRSYYNNKPLLSTRKSPELFGCWGFSGLTDFEEIVVQGKAEPAWLQGRIDAALERKRKAFERVHRPEAGLPGWLFASREPARAAPEARGKNRQEDEPEHPGSTPGSAESRRLEHVTTMLERGAYRACLAYLRRIDRDDIEEGRRAWVVARCHHGLGDLEKALTACDRVRTLHPDFLPAAVLRARLFHDQERSEEALQELRGLTTRHPGKATPHLALVRLLLGEERLDEAQVALEAASRGLGSCPELDALRRLYLKVAQGPSWPRTFEHRSAHYVVRSDIDRKVCVEASRLLEEAYRAYNVHLKRAPNDARRFRVYLFSGKAGFLAYCKDALGASPVNAAGVYSPLLRQLLIWNLPDRETMMCTVRHEGFHQYFHRIRHDPPTWLNEGLALYYETADHRSGRWQTGKVRTDYLKIVLALEKQGKRHSVEDLIRLSPRGFYTQAERTYPEAWALAHFLLHGPRQYRSIVEGAFQRTDRAGKGGEPGFEPTFRALDFAAMDREFLDYLNELASRT